MTAAERAAEEICSTHYPFGLNSPESRTDVHSIIAREYAELERAAEQADAALWTFAAITGREDAGNIYRNLRSALAKVRGA